MSDGVIITAMICVTMIVLCWMAQDNGGSDDDD